LIFLSEKFNSGISKNPIKLFPFVKKILLFLRIAAFFLRDPSCKRNLFGQVIL